LSHQDYHNFKGLRIKTGWDSDEDDILNDFYKVVLSKAVVYKRLAGYFSSTTFATAVSEALDFIARGGIMQLVTSVELSRQDLEVLQASLGNPEDFLESNLIDKLKGDTDMLAKKCTSLFGWMLANKIDGKPQLEMKLAIPIGEREDPSSIYHQKLGIFIDHEGNAVSFSGSVNETGKAWLSNIENFKAFTTWGSNADRDAVTFDMKQFEKFWKNSAKRTRVYDLPTAVREHLLKVRPHSTKEFDESIVEIRALLQRIQGNLPRRLWPNQLEAIEHWKRNGFRGILAMATGTGKTLAALEGCTLAPQYVVTLILVPTLVILDQWSEIIPRFDSSAELIKCGGHSKWKQLLALKLARVRRQAGPPVDKNQETNRLYVVATLATASTDAFALTWRGIGPEWIQIVGDEVHHLGAPEYRRCLQLPSSRRLGLSATPERQWDEPGTSATVDYFGPTVYTYDIKRAISDGLLCHYRYHPLFAHLGEQEFQQYEDLTLEIKREISRVQHKKQADEKEIEFVTTTTKLSRLLEERSKIKKKAHDKIRILDAALKKELPKPLILFCEDHEQLNDIRSVLIRNDADFLIYTSKQSKQQRSETLRLFRCGDVDVLLAIRCLDEGLDVPDCQACVIVASSTSTREFVQRRGRILRAKDSNKVAELYDIIVLPANVGNVSELRIAEGLIKQELVRVKQMLGAADNEWESRNEIRSELHEYGLDYLANL
jgi:superfamily II DNA or RNA helicase